jgi:hypothetical protein
VLYELEVYGIHRPGIVLVGSCTAADSDPTIAFVEDVRLVVIAVHLCVEAVVRFTHIYDEARLMFSPYLQEEYPANA